MGHTLAFSHPAFGNFRCPEIGQDLECLVRFDTCLAGIFPLIGQRIPTGFHTTFSLCQTLQWICNLVDGQGSCIFLCENWLEKLWSQLKLTPTAGHFRANPRPEIFKCCNGQSVFIRRINRATGPAGGHEDGPKGVIIALGDGLQLVVVASGTGHGGRQEDFREGVHLVINHLLMDPVEVQAAAVAMLSKVIKHGPDQAFIRACGGIDTRLFKQVASQLLFQELVETDVGIEGPNQIIAIFVRALGRVVPLISISVGVSNGVHPVACKPLAEVRRGQHLIHQRLISTPRIGLPIIQKSLALGRRRRQASQDKRQTS